jgi:hypothetical protein
MLLGAISPIASVILFLKFTMLLTSLNLSSQQNSKLPMYWGLLHKYNGKVAVGENYKAPHIR